MVKYLKNRLCCQWPVIIHRNLVMDGFATALYEDRPIKSEGAILMDEQNSDRVEEIFQIEDVSDEVLLRAAGGPMGPTRFECGLYPSQRC